MPNPVPKASYAVLRSPNAVEIHHLGPGIDQGPLPTLIYLALSGQASLTQDPYNQPAEFFAGYPVRILSFTLPFHGADFDPQKAMSLWAHALRQGTAWFEEFLQACRQNVDELVAKEWIDPQRLAVAGLSRGGFVAAHLAARDPRIGFILGYAPMTRLDVLADFKAFHLHPLDLVHLAPQLKDKAIRCYIGNRDTRVGTAACFAWIQALTEASYAAGHRSPPIELILSPSIGHKGHGTSPQTFRDGILWLKEKLAVENK